jgi:hypothetical protein
MRTTRSMPVDEDLAVSDLAGLRAPSTQHSTTLIDEIVG